MTVLMFRLAAGHGHSNVRHRGIGLCAMPVPLAGLDVHHIADTDLTLFFIGRHGTTAGCDHQDLITIVSVPAGGRSLVKVDHVAAVIVGVAVANDCLPGSDRKSVV